MAEELLDSAYLEEENERILTMVTAMYVRSLYPDFTIAEIFEKLQDVGFVKKIIYDLLKDLNNGGHDK
jgi:hypothetical protein